MKKERTNLKGTLPDPNKRLNEHNLLDWLSLIYPNTSDWCRDIKVRNSEGYIVSGILRPDYWSPSLKVIIEFDGIHHYLYEQPGHRQVRDAIAKKAGFTIIHIPFFLQMNEITVKSLFNVSLPFYSNLRNGYFFKEGHNLLDFTADGLEILRDNLINYPMPLRKDLIDSFNSFVKHKGVTKLPERLEVILNDTTYNPENWYIKLQDSILGEIKI